ncbi:MAG: hypothetical protein Q3965_00780 [Rothia sp. (in: high G+C Gram-positive bacteria)]|nr:hypothetical protein [Rothia sp. (in: high G+C Gram-positive bacteria)]
MYKKIIALLTAIAMFLSGMTTAFGQNVEGYLQEGMSEGSHLEGFSSFEPTSPQLGSGYLLDINFALTGESYSYHVDDSEYQYGSILLSDSVESLGEGRDYASPEAVPALVVLGVVARSGIQAALRVYTRTQIKKVAKSYVLNNLNSNKWNYIMAQKHLWGRVGASSKEQIAEIIGDAMANGYHLSLGVEQKRVHYKYKNQIVVVQYHAGTGKIADAWVQK